MKAMKIKYFLFVVLCSVSLSLVIYGCSTDEGNDDTSVAKELNENQEDSNTNSRSDTIVISGMKFTPEHLTINKGDTVVWVNNGLVVHDVTEVSLKTWTSDSIQVGAAWSKVPQEGFEYICSIHPTMTGSITVIDK